MTVGIFESFKNVNIDGQITRLLACNSNQLVKYKGLDSGPHSFTKLQVRRWKWRCVRFLQQTRSIMHFLEENVVHEPYILMLDADMIFVKPVIPVEMGAFEGNVVSEYVPYMDPAAFHLAKKFIPASTHEFVQPVGWYHVPPRRRQTNRAQMVRVLRQNAHESSALLGHGWFR